MKRKVSLALITSFLLFNTLFLPLTSAGDTYDKIDFTSDDINVQVFVSSEITPGVKQRLIDGISSEWNSRWSSAIHESLTDIGEWILIDLGEQYLLDKFAFYAVAADGRGMPKAFSLEISETGEEGSWVTVYECASLVKGSGIAYEFPFTPTNGRYVRFNIDEVYSAWAADTIYVTLVEFELYGVSTGYVPPLSPDKITIGEDGRLFYTAYLPDGPIPGFDKDNQLITAGKSLEVGWASGYGKGYLIDGKADGKHPVSHGLYASANLAEDGITLNGVNETPDVNEYIQLNLLDEFLIDTLGFAAFIKGSNRGIPQNFTIEVSNDGTSWTTVYTETGLLAQSGTLWHFFEFEPMSCRYIRLNVTKIADMVDDNLKYSLVLSELAVYLAGDEYVPPIIPVPEPLPDLVTVKEDGRIDLSAYLENRSTYLDMPNFDIDNQIITASKSLEVTWMPGYGKGYLIDGIARGDDYPVDHGVFVSLNFGADGDFQGVNDTENVDEWVILNLQKTFTIDKVALGSWRYGDEYGFPKDFEIKVSDDGVNWTTVLTVKDFFVPFNKTLHTFSFEPVSCQYVQLHATRICDMFDGSVKYALVLSEFAVYQAQVS